MIGSKLPPSTAMRWRGLAELHQFPLAPLATLAPFTLTLTLIGMSAGGEPGHTECAIMSEGSAVVFSGCDHGIPMALAAQCAGCAQLCSRAIVGPDDSWQKSYVLLQVIPSLWNTGREQRVTLRLNQIFSTQIERETIEPSKLE